jgi:hypothetical protein
MDWCKYIKIWNFLNTVKRHWAIGNGAIEIHIIIIIILWEHGGQQARVSMV